MKSTVLMKKKRFPRKVNNARKRKKGEKNERGTAKLRTEKTNGGKKTGPKNYKNKSFSLASTDPAFG